MSWGITTHFMLKTSDADKKAVRSSNFVPNNVASADDKEIKKIKAGTIVGDWIPIVAEDQCRPSAEEVADNPLARAHLDGTLQERLRDIVAENATGNHGPRNHRIGVPTRAGEPVRG